MESIRHWIALKYIPGVGNHLYKELLQRFETPSRVFSASRKELLDVEGVSGEVAASILSGPRSAEVNRELSLAEKQGCRIIPLNHEEYPPLLREIPDPPPYLYVMGSIENCGHGIALVGSRRATGYGKSMARQLAADLACSGFIVVSGLARGIDTESHKGVLSKGGRTIAVLGSGLSVIYPFENRALAERICEAGAVISEFPMKEEPNPYNFPKRNRIISGICLGTVVVEAAEKSGALITARLAAEQGREVFAVPGSIKSRTSRGAHNLLKQGAKLVAGAEDVLEEFPYLFLKSDKNRGKEQNLGPVPDLTTEEEQVYSMLEPYPVHIDELGSRLEISAARLSAILAGLELKGLAVQLPGMYFSTHGDAS